MQARKHVPFRVYFHQIGAGHNPLIIINHQTHHQSSSINRIITIITTITIIVNHHQAALFIRSNSGGSSEHLSAPKIFSPAAAFPVSGSTGRHASDRSEFDLQIQWILGLGVPSIFL